MVFYFTSGGHKATIVSSNAVSKWSLTSFQATLKDEFWSEIKHSLLRHRYLDFCEDMPPVNLTFRAGIDNISPTKTWELKGLALIMHLCLILDDAREKYSNSLDHQNTSPLSQGCLPTVCVCWNDKLCLRRWKVGSVCLRISFHMKLLTPLWFGLYFDSC